MSNVSRFSTARDNSYLLIQPDSLFHKDHPFHLGEFTGADGVKIDARRDVISRGVLSAPHDGFVTSLLELVYQDRKSTRLNSSH